MSNLKFYLLSLIFKLKPVLKHEMGKDLSRRIMNRMKDHYKEIDKRKPKEKGIMRFHRMFLIMGLSLYRAMQDELDKRDDLVERIHEILWECRMRKVTGLLAFFVRRSKDPYDRFLRWLGPKNERFFPCPPWEKVEVELENGIGWNQMKCPYYDFFKDEGVVELTKAYCDLDRRIAELVPDHIELKRQHTLAKGDNWCDFYYYQK
jgi:hypothetical protein